ncbi:MAG: transcription-repair coupling factor, partial [Oceanipulchritudo sp.]
MKRFRIPAGPQVERFSGIIPAARPLVLADRIRRATTPVSVIFFPRIDWARDALATVPAFGQLAPVGETRFQWALLPPPPPEDTEEDPVPERLREELECDRLAALTQLSNFAASPPSGEHLVVLTTPEGCFAPAPARESLASREIRLRAGETVAFNRLREQLARDLDYDAEAVCERPGQFALRGGLIDIYPLNGNAPCRLDFFGDELESIRWFDPTTQRSLGPVREITLAARNAGETKADPAAIGGYFGEAVSWILVEPTELAESFPKAFTSFEKIKDQRPTLQSLHAGRNGRSDTWTGLQELEEDPLCLDSAILPQPLPFESLEPYRRQPLESTVGLERLEEETEARRGFFRHLQEWSGSGSTEVIGMASSDGKVKEIEALLDEHGAGTLQPRFLTADVPEGFLLTAKPPGWLDWMEPAPATRLVIVSEREWLGRHAARRPESRRRLLPHRTRVDSLLDFADLADGDYLVHLSHGICRYRGLSRMEVRGREEEVISVEFAENVTLHVPLPDAHLLTRYVGLTRLSPRLGKLGSNQWDKTRAAAEKATIDYAAEMLQLQAQRAHGPGFAFGHDTAWQSAFENAFPFTETPDQAEAIEDAKRDMEQPRPMDRLLCGDVGFGKTEVAIRAAFKAVMDGYQVALMVPTTVLAQQHFETFRERFAPYPVTVEMLSRFRNPAQQKQIVAELAGGKIDLVIGTHRLLSQDVRFARLGLLVIDEEHRFGVRHKERLKTFKAEVDVLSMSATPIPRTLYLALMGARDLSVIETPPADRLPIETLVRSYDENLVKRAVTRELDRGGQVFYLHNRVQSIDSVATRLRELVPSARVEVGHGQMSEGQLERIMTRFVAHKVDILVCTTIIENGLDIPNCNTILIEGADRFGLSQLYQLRGRVGRFKRQAYAYLLLHRHGRMLDLARKRLSAMRQHNQLGAGFRIAMRDLELRGAGNLLGHQQSGHIAGVGFDLYCQLLRQSIQRLKGQPEAARIRASVALDFIVEGRAGEASARRDETGFGALLDEEIATTRIEPVPAYIPGDYIAETRLRIEFYRQLA